MPSQTQQLETRVLDLGPRIEIREDMRPRIVGYAIVFGRLSEDLGGFREQVDPAAVDRALQRGVDIRALVDHDGGKVIGRTKSRTLKLEKDKRGLIAEIDPPNTTTARDIIESVQRGDIDGMSFAFRTLEEAWDWEANPPIRTLLDIEIREISIVAFPAYPQTEVAVRSLVSARAAHAARPRVTLAAASERLRAAEAV